MSDAVLILARNAIRSGTIRRALVADGITVHESLRAGEDLDLGGDAESIRAVVVGADRIDDAWLERYPGVELVVRAGSGTDNITLDARAANVTVASVPGANAESVADFTFALMLAAARRIPEADRLVRGGGWGLIDGVDLYRKTLGIIGYGAIGRAVRRRAIGFDMRVLVASRSDPFDPSVEPATIDEVLEQSDIVSLHLPLIPETRGIIDAERIARMRSGAVLINTSRGAIVDEAALAAALSVGRLRGAGIDAFSDEPPGDSPLLTAPGAVLSPHSASFGDDATRRTDAAVLSMVRTLLFEGRMSVTQGKEHR